MTSANRLHSNAVPLPCLTKNEDYNMNAETFFENLNNSQLYDGKIMLFDLDGTLIDTNLANNDAYKYALYKVTGTSDYTSLSNLHRITRNDVEALNEVTPQMLEDIINYKRNVYKWKLEYTYPTIAYEILKQVCLKTPCYLISVAEKSRVIQLGRYWDLSKYTKDCIFADNEDKYKDIADKLKVDVSNIILFEDDESAIANAIDNGIEEGNIIRINTATLKKHTILQNEYLRNNVEAYFSRDYMRLGHPDNPNFINTLKNQFGYGDLKQLNSALDILKKYLKRDIRCIYKLINVNELTIVGIPRSKAENYYSPEQQFFRRGIQEAIKELQNELHLNLIDGTLYITRHTNTKTTHLAKKDNVENDGDMPYPGITRSTCNISEEVSGKDILLIDDIYTLDVNIDEDAIQALYDKGANSVRFYSVCKTFKIRRRKQ